MSPFIPSKIVSGGQTGADRGGLDAAIALGIPHGGLCPKGRKAEDGVIPSCYQLTETASADYLKRTEWNVRDSDATLIFTDVLPFTGGTKRTLDFVKKYGRPHLVVAMNQAEAPVEIRRWLTAVQPGVLNVAGPRESKAPGVQAFVAATLMKTFTPSLNC
jgi:hypothetical protein